MIKPPCKQEGIDCPNRMVGCHQSCLKYQKYREEIQKFRQFEKQQRAIQQFDYYCKTRTR